VDLRSGLNAEKRKITVLLGIEHENPGYTACSIAPIQAELSWLSYSAEVPAIYLD
jgi:hypothetical protein